MGKRRRDFPIQPWSTDLPANQFDILVTKESMQEAKKRAQTLSRQSPEEQISILSELPVADFRLLLKYYKPQDWMVNRIMGRRRRLGLE